MDSEKDTPVHPTYAGLMNFMQICTTVVLCAAYHRNSQRYQQRHHADLYTARRALLLEHVVRELSQYIAGWIVFTDDIPALR